MKMVYSNENHFLANNIKNLIEAQKIKTFIKNEFAQGAVGEISAFDSWPEVWIIDDNQYEQAMDIVNSLKNQTEIVDWHCNGCSESNDSSFEICWNCQEERVQIMSVNQ